MYKSLAVAGLLALATSIGAVAAHESGKGSRHHQDLDRYNNGPLSGAYVIQQKSSGRYIDAYESPRRDFEIVTREPQDDDTQVWILTPFEQDAYIIEQASSGRYMDAYQYEFDDFQLVTREPQDDATQLWILTRLHGDVYTIQQASTGRYLDAYERSRNDFRVVTRPFQDNRTQHWILQKLYDDGPLPDIRHRYPKHG